MVRTSIATTNHEDGGGRRDVIANKGSERRVTLVPVKGTSLLDVPSVPIHGVAIVVRVAARHVPVHLDEMITLHSSLFTLHSLKYSMSQSHSAFVDKWWNLEHSPQICLSISLPVNVTARVPCLNPNYPESISILK